MGLLCRKERGEEEVEREELRTQLLRAGKQALLRNQCPGHHRPRSSQCTSTGAHLQSGSGLGSAQFSYKGPEGKCVRLCESHGLCHASRSTATCSAKAATASMQANRCGWVPVTLYPWALKIELYIIFTSQYTWVGISLNH